MVYFKRAEFWHRTRGEERRTDEGVHEVRLETLEEYLDQAEGEPVSATGNFFAVN